MTVLQESREIYVDETERKPNIYAANILAVVAVVISVVCVLIESGVFFVDEMLVRICLALALLQFGTLRIILSREKWLVCPKMKYMILAMVLLLVLTITVLMNIHAVLVFTLPILLASRYRSKAATLAAVLGSVLCCAAAPILAWRLGTWSLEFLTGFVETICNVTITVSPGNSISTAQAIKLITLYWSLPQMIILGGFGIILYSVTLSGMESVDNQIRVANLSRDLNEQLDSIMTMQEHVLCSMSDIIESRDVETGSHVKRTSEIVRLLVDAMHDDPNSGVTEDFCSDVIKSAPMHDLGKIAIPDTVLRKPGKLTAEEYETVKLHTTKSEEMIVSILTGIEDEHLLNTAKNIAKYHHERVDGTGYPEKLKGKQIPLEARIMAIADVYDALVSERCYKAAVSFDEAFDTIENSMGTQFDADLNPYFLSCRQNIEQFYRV